MLNRVAAVALLLALPGVCTAHRDTVIPVERNGALARLPKQYQPANLQVRFERPGMKGVSAVRLSIGSHVTSLPTCLVKYLRSEKNSEVKVTSSWYHESGSLPAYLNISFFDPGFEPDRFANHGYSLLFDLNTGKLIRMDVTVIRDNGKAYQSLPIDIREICSADEALRLGK